MQYAPFFLVYCLYLQRNLFMSIAHTKTKINNTKRKLTVQKDFPHNFLLNNFVSTDTKHGKKQKGNQITEQFNVSWGFSYPTFVVAVKCYLISCLISHSNLVSHVHDVNMETVKRREYKK